MNTIYNVYWTQTALDEISGILAYPPEVKERIYLESVERLKFTPTLTSHTNSDWEVKGIVGKAGDLSGCFCI